MNVLKFGAEGSRNSLEAARGRFIISTGGEREYIECRQQKFFRLVNSKLSTEADIGQAELQVGHVELTERAALAASNAASDWLCAWCLNHVAREKDRFAYDGRDEFAFTNPDGIRFEIITFSQTIGCRESGEPTLEHTWFPGHAWSFCHCDRCGQHLGWCYSGAHEFVGLIKDRIVRAIAIMN